MRKNSHLKILYFITDLGVGGAEQLLLLTLKNLNREKYKPYVCCFYTGVIASEIKDLDIKVIDFGVTNKFDISVLFKLYKLLMKEKFDIIHTHLFHANVIGRIMGRLCNVPIVISTLHYAFSYNGNFGIFLERLTANLADRIIVVSDAVKKFCIYKVGIPDKKIKLIYNGVDLDIKRERPAGVSNLREQLSLNGFFIVGCIGRFEEVKGHAYLFKAIAEVAKVYHKIRLLLVGSGALEKSLKKLAEELGILEKVIFLDSRRDIPQILDSLDLYVQPSLQEGLSITLLEVLAMGKPSVVTAVGGNTEVIIDGESGMITPPKDYAAMAEALIYLIRNRDKAEQLGIHGRNRVIKNFNIKDNVSKTESLYELLIREKRVGGYINEKKNARFYSMS